jgi:hypothetical protein
MEPEGSLPHSQVPATCPYPELARSSPCHVHFSFLSSYQSINPGPRQVFMTRNKASFYGEELSTPSPTPKHQYHPLSDVRDYLFNIFAATLHTGGRSSICNLRTCHAVVTGTHLSRQVPYVLCTTSTVCTLHDKYSSANCFSK